MILRAPDQPSSSAAKLRRASVHRARAVVVAVDRDDAAVLITLTARRLNPDGRIATSVREMANAALLRQSGADTVLTTSATSGRLLGLAPGNPRVVGVMEDLLEHGVGLDFHERPARAGEVGLDPRQLPDIGRGSHEASPMCTEQLIPRPPYPRVRKCCHLDEQKRAGWDMVRGLPHRARLSSVKTWS
ncbi:NAD-binding protein [Geodermatophilus sp. SYSU D00965]